MRYRVVGRWVKRRNTHLMRQFFCLPDGGLSKQSTNRNNSIFNFYAFSFLVFIFQSIVTCFKNVVRANEMSETSFQNNPPTNTFFLGFLLLDGKHCTVLVCFIVLGRGKRFKRGSSWSPIPVAARSKA